MDTIPALDTSDAGVAKFINDPASFFDLSMTRVHAVPKDQLEALQLAALKKRFQELRDNIPTLKMLADEQHADEINSLDDVAPLLFSHTVYKSYPISILEKGRFTQLTNWLNRLTTVDLSKVDVSNCQGIDEWIGTLTEKTPIRIQHSSGTTGAMSFIPRTAGELDRAFRLRILAQFDYFGLPIPTENAPASMHVLAPSFRSGHTTALRANDFSLKWVAGGDEKKMHALYPSKQSSDMMFLAGRIRAAQAKGELDRLQLSPALLARKAEFEALHRNQAEDTKAFFDEIVTNLRGEKIYTSGTWNLLYNVAAPGLAAGQKNVFSPESMLMTGGGSKGQVVPPDWEERVKEFFGVSKLLHGYGMSEVMGSHLMCEHERYHIVPWNILLILDPDSSAPLPRTGVQTGRAAFYDLLAETYWGGFVSGDEITVDWSTPCACGRKSPHIARKVERYSEQRGGDDKISCAAAADAHDAALSYLNDVLG